MNEVKKHVNLVICTPGHSLTSDYVESLLETLLVLSKENITWSFSNQYSSNVADAREITASGSRVNIIEQTEPFGGHVTYDKMMWIDSDISWKPEDILKLYYSDKDIISGGYILGYGDVAIYPEEGKRGFSVEQVLNMKEPIKISGCGFGFVCIKSGVFESLSRPWFQSVKGIFDDNGNKIEYMIMGEDLSFCKRAENAGFEIWFDPAVLVDHKKTLKLTWKGISFGD